MGKQRQWATGGAAMLVALALLGGQAPRAVGAPAPPAVTIIPVRDGFAFRVGADLVTTYHHGPEVAKPYLWPLHAPGGTPVTRSWPLTPAQAGDSTDHVHQKSAWFCHGDVIPEGIELKQKVKGVEGIDFWSETAGHGVIRCVAAKVVESPSGPPALVTWNEWVSADGVKVLDEKRTLRLHALPQGYLLTVEVELTASVCPITFGDTKEGSFGVRVRDSLNAQQSLGQMLLNGGKGRLVNAEGKDGEGKNNNRDRTGCWGLPSTWCDYSGLADGQHVGIAVFADPKNPVPSYWHARGYGLLAANPFGRTQSGFPGVPPRTALVKLAKGEALRLRFGILTHAGDEKEGKVAEAFTAFVGMKP
jgi:hypothetical protein